MTITHDESATLTWLGEALEYTCANGRERVVGYLEAVLDDVEFEMEMTARR